MEDNQNTPTPEADNGAENTPEVKPAAPATVNVGGLTLKKRTPGASGSSGSGSVMTSTTSPGGARQLSFTPRPGGTGGAPGAFVRPTGPSPNVQKRMERFSRVMPTRDPGVRMNENIRVPEIRVIDDNGQLGVMTPREALEIARERGLDLIEIVANAQPPVCKIIDFGKWKYEQQKRDKMAKKSSHQQLLKEIRFHPNTDTHDFDFKLRHARTFLQEGHKVKAYVQFKGREVAYKQFGEELLNNFKAGLEDLAKVDQDISMMGRMMSMVLSPTGKRKAAIVDAKKADAAKGQRPPKPTKPEPVEDLGPDFTESSVDDDDEEIDDTLGMEESADSAEATE